MRLAFYAPLKPPDHPVPSGDRRMAQLLMAALPQQLFLNPLPIFKLIMNPLNS